MPALTDRWRVGTYRLVEKGTRRTPSVQNTRIFCAKMPGRIVPHHSLRWLHPRVGFHQRSISGVFAQPCNSSANCDSEILCRRRYAVAYATPIWPTPCPRPLLNFPANDDYAQKRCKRPLHRRDPDASGSGGPYNSGSAGQAPAHVHLLVGR